ncbi:aldehyde dehydrogenase family protein [Microbacterium gorillae]|uniref:aldehyde dehydrogenase family protein n=1 Tax=Microbacterium gorillae TaxID=1231063 RepID=UPI0005912DFC|nr:aldehyde dehydrogenase family protein [Microbacterium gorillae]
MASTATPVWDGKIFSDGWTAGGDGTIDVIAPGSGRSLGTVGSASVADLDAAVTSAAAAQKAWAAAPYAARAAVMLKAAQLLEADTARLTDVIVAESGSGGGKAAFEAGLVISELQEAAAVAAHPYGELLRSVKDRTSIARRVPLGIVGVISPFNFPAILSMRSVAPALALGNAVILKPDPRTSIAGGMALAALFEEAGLPAGVLHVLPGGAELGAALVTHPQIPCISFTGSTAAGRKIAESAAPLLKRVHLELGGNNAMLVLEDADPAAAATVGAWGSFLHQGQICMTTGRHLVPRSLAEAYVAALAEKASHIPVGDPEQGAPLGPLIDERQRDRVHGIVEAARESGARIAAGGEYDGLFYRPTVITDLSPESSAWADEIFGPVAPVIVYDDLDEAIEMINASEYGLSVSIITANPYRGYELAGRIESGAIHINDATVDDEAVIPFGGVKASGVGGRFGGPAASLDTFTETQWITMQSEPEPYPF